MFDAARLTSDHAPAGSPLSPVSHKPMSRKVTGAHLAVPDIYSSSDVLPRIPIGNSSGVRGSAASRAVTAWRRR